MYAAYVPGLGHIVHNYIYTYMCNRSVPVSVDVCVCLTTQIGSTLQCESCPSSLGSSSQSHQPPLAAVNNTTTVLVIMQQKGERERLRGSLHV